MSDFVLTFQNDVSTVLEAVLNSAVMEITKLFQSRFMVSVEGDLNTNNGLSEGIRGRSGFNTNNVGGQFFCDVGVQTESTEAPENKRVLTQVDSSAVCQVDTALKGNTSMYILPDEVTEREMASSVVAKQETEEIELRVRSLQEGMLGSREGAGEFGGLPGTAESAVVTQSMREPTLQGTSLKVDPLDLLEVKFMQIEAEYPFEAHHTPGGGAAELSQESNANEEDTFCSSSACVDSTGDVAGVACNQEAVKGVSAGPDLTGTPGVEYAIESFCPKTNFNGNVREGAVTPGNSVRHCDSLSVVTFLHTLSSQSNGLGELTSLTAASSQSNSLRARTSSSLSQGHLDVPQERPVEEVPQWQFPAVSSRACVLLKACSVQLVNVMMFPESRRRRCKDLHGRKIKDLRVHRRYHTGKRLCCFTQGEDGVWRMQGTPPEGKLFACRVCSRSFKRRALLRRHRKQHARKRAYECKVCEKNFRLWKNLRRHYGRHTEVKPYSCPICGDRFRYRDRFEIHLIFHENGRAFRCFYCERPFCAFKSDKERWLKHADCALKAESKLSRSTPTKSDWEEAPGAQGQSCSFS